MSKVTLKTFTEEEYHQFFKGYISDPVMDPEPFVYNEEQVSRSYRYNHFFRENYAHYGIYLDDLPIGSFQLKRIDTEKKKCEFGIILQNDAYKNRGIGTEAVYIGMMIAEHEFGMETVWADTSGRNRRMQHILEKLGYELVEKVPDAIVYPDGSRADRLVYRISLVPEQS